MMYLGLAPQKLHIRNMADGILAGRGDTPHLKVGNKWVDKSIIRSEVLKVRSSIPNDYKLLFSEDPKMMAWWFSVMEQAIKKDGILKEDILNVDETGFAMGQMQRYSLVMGTDTCGSIMRKVKQSDKREWTTVIECINANGDFLSPTVISKGKVFLQYHVDALL